MPEGIDDIQKTSEKISQLVNTKIEPMVYVNMTPYEVEKGRKILQLEIDALLSQFNKIDLSFSVFEANYRMITQKRVEDSDYISFKPAVSQGRLTYAGVIFCAGNRGASRYV